MKRLGVNETSSSTLYLYKDDSGDVFARLKCFLFLDDFDEYGGAGVGGKRGACVRDCLMLDDSPTAATKLNKRKNEREREREKKKCDADFLFFFDFF